MNEVTFSKIPATKTEQQAMAQQFAKLVQEGVVNPIEAFVKMKSMQETINSFMKDETVKSLVIEECDKYGKGETPQYLGASAQVKETAVKYDFTGCNDDVILNLYEKKRILDEKIKERETYLKAIRQPKTEIDEETGNVYTVYPPARSSTTTIAITFKK